MRKLNYGCGVVAQNFLLNYSLFKITLNPSKKVEFSSEKQKDMSDDGIFLFKQLLFSKVGFTTFATKAVKPTLLNKSCSNQKINATLLFQF